MIKSEHILDAIGMINEEAVREAKEYQRPTSRNWIRWGAVAACLCLLLAGMFPMFNQPTISPFVLTAYALEADNTISATVMQEGENTAVTLFETANGLRGFVFSYATDESEEPISVSITSTGQQLTLDEEMEIISGLKIDSTQNYLFFVLPQDDPGPYSITFTLSDQERSEFAWITLSIEQTEGGYTSIIEKITSYPREKTP